MNIMCKVCLNNSFNCRCTEFGMTRKVFLEKQRNQEINKFNSIVLTMIGKGEEE